jgi:hypothetical protein
MTEIDPADLTLNECIALGWGKDYKDGYVSIGMGQDKARAYAIAELHNRRRKGLA